MPALCLKFSSYLTNREIRLNEEVLWNPLGHADGSLLFMVMCMHGKTNSMVLCCGALKLIFKKSKTYALKTLLLPAISSSQV